MKPDARIIIAAAAVALVVGCIAGDLMSDHRIARLNEKVRSAESKAADLGNRADAAELRAAEFGKQIEFLEKGLAGIAEAAKEQNEQIRKVESDVGGARRDVDGKRRVRAIRTNTDELCAKLAALGHACG